MPQRRSDEALGRVLFRSTRANETTPLDVNEERAFQAWVRANGIPDVDHVESFYDYRGYWKATRGKPHPKGEHFPDTFKQHGHPSFSVESKYSRGKWDGGTWIEGTDTLVPPLAVSHGRGR